MASTIKHLRKVAAKIEVTPGTFLAPDVLIPRTEFTIHQEFNMIEDASIIGLAFKDLPDQGVRIVLGTLAGELDVLASAPILEAVFGSVSGGGPFTYDLPTDKNVKTLSIVALDGVKTNKYAGCVIPQITFSSEAEGRVMFNADIIGFKAEVRDGTAFPTIVTEPGDKLLHQHAGGASGFIRIADQVDALTSGDDRGLTSWELIINWQFDNQFDNTLQGSLLQLSGAAGRPEATLGFVVSRHENDDFLGFRDNDTKLQAQIKIFKSATSIFDFSITNFKISESQVNDDDVAGQDVATMMARNGIGAGFTNANMAFNTPVRLIVTNS